ncbi:MAG: hypothetical protein ABI114_15045 [Rhodanobacter sp.]
MTPAHLANLGVHIAAGTIALAIGFTMLANAKGTLSHRRMGRIFCYFTLLVCCSAAIGTVFFRFVPIFAVLSILVPYQLIGAWRSACTRAQGPAGVDAAWTVLALAVSIALTPAVLRHSTVAPIVVYSSLGALATLLFYDAIRWLFPRRWYRVLWKYEHAYKMIASIFGMLSALVGNVIRVGQPWSQILPSVAGVLVVIYIFCKLYRQDKMSLTYAGMSQTPEADRPFPTGHSMTAANSIMIRPIAHRETTP